LHGDAKYTQVANGDHFQGYDIAVLHQVMAVSVTPKMMAVLLVLYDSNGEAVTKQA
jgi:hypothetical protein